MTLAKHGNDTCQQLKSMENVTDFQKIYTQIGEEFMTSATYLI